MTRSQATPASSQMIGMENVIAKLEQEQERDALAAQNQALREVTARLGITLSALRLAHQDRFHPSTVAQIDEDFAAMNTALALHDLSAEILRARDAKHGSQLLRDIAAAQDALRGGVGLLPFELRKLADELEQAK